jgi:SAM-dependent methyltransferase
MPELYDDIGVGYRDRRRPDPRVAAAISRALAGADSVVNVGAGAGSYEPADRFVVAVEPAMTMIRQRRAGSAPVVQAVAADLPFRDAGFAVALAILTIHHWPDKARGLDELARVARRRVVVVTWDPSISGFWLADDYFPEIFETDRKIFPTIEDYRRALGRIDVSPMPIPHDCVDGFLGAYWRRPHAYLDAGVRGAISTFAKLPPRSVESGVERLRRDLEDGTWARRHGHLVDRTEIDLGYRIVVAARL